MNNLTKSILKANKKQAEHLSAQLLTYKTKKDNPLFVRTEIEHGFEIGGLKKINGKWEKVIIFRYTNDNGRQLIEYDKELITI